MKLLLVILTAITLNADCGKLKTDMFNSYDGFLTAFKSGYANEIGTASQVVKRSVITVISSCNNISDEELKTLFKIKVRMDEVAKEIYMAEHKGG